MCQKWLLMCLYVCSAAAVNLTASSLQLSNFAAKVKKPIGILTADNGAPVEIRDTKALTSNLLWNEPIMDQMVHTVRERIPERSVHAKGTGAFGYFEVTSNFSVYCKAKLFSEIGKKTKVAVRFSTGTNQLGGSDLFRDSHGMAIKLYTDDGNLDLPGFITPVYFYKDPAQFTSFVHAFKKNPVTALFDPTARWDFITSHPESMHFFMMVFGDRGIPANYRVVSGHPIHTYQTYNDKGESYFCRFHFISDLPFDYLSSEEANAISDPDYFVRDLYNAIANGSYPSWTVYAQVLTMEQFEEGNPSKIVDVTRILPEDQYPMLPIGRLVLNEHPRNHFADVEQAAYCPGNLVPGILGGCDKIFESRRLSYRDAQLYRLGSNFKRIPVNCPHRVLSLNRDGVPHLGDNYGGIPNYYGDSFNGAKAYEDPDRPELVKVLEKEEGNFDQASKLYNYEMTEGERTRMIDNLVSNLNEIPEFLQIRAIELFGKIEPDFANRVANKLGLNNTQYFENSNEVYCDN